MVINTDMEAGDLGLLQKLFCHLPGETQITTTNHIVTGNCGEIRTLCFEVFPLHGHALFLSVGTLGRFRRVCLNKSLEVWTEIHAKFKLNN